MSLKEELLKVERCEGDMECPEDYEGDNPCAECRSNAVLKLIEARIDSVEIPEDEYEEYTCLSAYLRGVFDYKNQIKASLRQELPDS